MVEPAKFEGPMAVLSNPLSGRNRKAMGSIRGLLSARSEVPHREAVTPAEVSMALEELLASRPGLLVLNGGDGTVQAALSHLFASRRPLPLLAIPRGGTTNMTAGDVGLRRGPVRALRILLDPQRRSALKVVTRPVLAVASRPGAEERCGMFFGAGAIIRGIRYYHERVRKVGLRNDLGPGLAIARVVAAILRRDPEVAGPVAMTLEGDGQTMVFEGEGLILLVSALQRLFLGMHPYWGEEDAPLRCSLVRARPRRFAWVLPGLLRGRPGARATPEAGYDSHNLAELKLWMDGDYTLDGEIYGARRAEGPVCLRCPGTVRFLRL